MLNKVQNGKVLEYTNGGASTITGGSVVISGGLVGIAVADILVGETGSVELEGVFALPKAAPLVITQGDIVYWDVADGNINKTATDNTKIGLAFNSALSAGTTVNVVLTNGI